MTYNYALRIHYFFWKWCRISNQSTLAFLRKTLMKHELVEVNPEPSWIVNRSSDEYNIGLSGVMEEQLTKLSFDALSGKISHTSPQIALDAGSGNCTAIYESARPWILFLGSGYSLLFSLDGTLRNWLRESLQGEQVKGYNSTLLNSTLELAEIWSILNFVNANHQEEFNPFEKLVNLVSSNESGINASEIELIHNATSQSLESLKESNLKGEKIISALSLGYLLDALVGRVTVPNGMQFSYQQNALSFINLEDMFNAIKDFGNPSLLREQFLSSQAEMEDFQKRIKGHLNQADISPTVDYEIKEKLPIYGDLFRQIGFELADQGGDILLIEVVQELGNSFWKWNFFLEDLSLWKNQLLAQRSAYDNRFVVQSWLDRPWGILRIEDMKLALADSSDAPNELPKMLTPLIPLLRFGIKAFIESDFPDEPNIDIRLRDLIGQRCRLRDLRGSIKWVSYDDSENELRDLADLIIDLLTTWFYHQPENIRQKISQEQLEPLRKTLFSGDWLKELNKTKKPLLSRRQRKLLSIYESDTVQLTMEMFEFGDDLNLIDRLDVYPPEEFLMFPDGMGGSS